MCSTKPVVDHLVLTETGSDGIGDVEINEWSELLTNEHEIAITRNIPVSLAAITESSRRINGKFRKVAEPITSTWNNRNSIKNADSIQSHPQRNGEYFITSNDCFNSHSMESDSIDSLSSPPPPKLPPKSSNIINNLNMNGHGNILNNMNGKTFGNHIASHNSTDWIELKTTNHANSRTQAENSSSSSVGGLKRGGMSTSSSTTNNGNISMRPPPPPPSSAHSHQNSNALSASNASRKLSSTSSSSLSSSSMSSSMTLAVTCSPSSKEKCISIRNPHQDLPGIHIPSNSNHQRAMHSSSSTGVSPTSSSSSSSTTVGSSPSGILQHPMSHSFNSSTLVQARECNGIAIEAGDRSAATNNFTQNVINNENYKPTGGGASTTILSQLVSSSSSQKILVHQQHPSSITTTTVLSAISSSASGINSNHDKPTKNNNAMQFVLSNASSTSSSSSSCCNDTVTNVNSNCAKEKIIRGKSNFVRHHNHHPLKNSSKNGSHMFMSENKKSPAPQPPILQQPVRPKMILIHQRSLEFNGAAQPRNDNEDDVSFEFSSNSAITKQPTK